MILNKHIRSFDYEGYKAFINELAEKDLCTGKLTADHIQETKMNAHRIKRIDHQVEIIPELKEAIQRIEGNWEWILLMESWCGDGAQNLPIIAQIAGLSNKIKLRLILRDENPDIMDAHLTNGARAIPKVICLNKADNKEIGIWGPRPASIQEKVKKLKTEEPSISNEEFGKHLHLWYAKDKGLSIQYEFIDLINKWINKSSSN